MYQGWSNEDTWRVAYILNNTKDYQDKCLSFIEGKDKRYAIMSLIDFSASIAIKKFINNDMKLVALESVNWDELYINLLMKLEEDKAYE